MFAALLLLPLTMPTVELPDLKLASIASDLRRFPTEAECRRWIERANKHLVWIDEEIPLHIEDRAARLLYREQIIDWRDAWIRIADALDTARRPPLILEDRKRLEMIRGLIGDANYRRGYVPPPLAKQFWDMADD